MSSSAEQAVHRAVEGLPRAGAALAHDPPGRAQIGVGEGALLRVAVAGRAEDHQLVVAPRHHFEIGVLDLALDQADVDVEVCHPPRDLLGVGHGERELGPGVLAHEARHQRGHQVVADREGRADAQPPDGGAPLERGLELDRPVEHALGLRPHRLSQLAQPQPLADAIEELQPELPLQVPERAAHRRLRHRQRFAGAADAADAGDGQEDLELTEGVAHIGSTAESYQIIPFYRCERWSSAPR